MEKAHQILDVLRGENDLSLLAELYVGLSHDLQRLLGPWEFTILEEGGVRFSRRALTSGRTVAWVNFNSEGRFEGSVFGKRVTSPLVDRGNLFTKIDKQLQNNNWRRLGTPFPHLTPWTETAGGWARFTGPLDPQREPVEIGWVGPEDIDGRCDWRFLRLSGQTVTSDDMYLPKTAAMDYVDAKLREDVWACP